MGKSFKFIRKSIYVSSAGKLAIIAFTCCVLKIASENINFSSFASSWNIDGISIPYKIIQMEFGSYTDRPVFPVELEFPLSFDHEKSKESTGINCTNGTENNRISLTDTTTLSVPEANSNEENKNSAPTTDNYEAQDKSYSADYITIKNTTDYTIDVESLLSKELGFSANDGAEVLIVHTHGSEAYSPSDGNIYEESDHYRTLDKNYNVVKIGSILEEELEKKNITVTHDETLYDYPNYNDSYSNAAAGIFSAVEKNENIKIVIDLHRDAMEDEDGTVYKTIADIGDTPCAQIMLVVGTNGSGLSHDKWEENLSFALKIQSVMNEKYPTLARPLNITKYRYNQHATTGSIIVEVGCNGNTLTEASNAIKYFADCLAEVLYG